jgi:hypothetical protein
MGREEGRRCASQPSAREREDRAARRREEEEQERGLAACAWRLKKGEGILVRQVIAAVCSRLTMAF